MHTSSNGRKREILAASCVGVATLICLFGQLGAIGLVGPDEPRYVWIARAMAQTGDWVTPRLYGSPWFEKPILYYWAAAIGFRFGLPAEWAARLPSALAALAATLTVAWLGWKYYGTERYCPWSPPLLAALFFSTSVAAIGFSRAATPDMLFTASITLAMASAAVILRPPAALDAPPEPDNSKGKGDFASLALFGIFLGLAVLAKGPAAIVLAAGAIGIWALATRRWRLSFRMLHPFAIVAFCVVALPWYVVCAQRNPEFVHIFLFEHNFERYLTPIFQHRQPFWFFIPITLLAVIPWLAFILPATRDGLRLWRENSWRESPAFFFACWALFPILFFSFSQSKLPSYILPAMPALALVLAISAARAIEANSPKYRWTFALFGFTWIAPSIGGFIWLRGLLKILEVQVRVPILTCCGLATLSGLAIALLARRRQRATIWISLPLICALMEIAGFAVLPKLDPYYSARLVGTMLRGDVRPDRLFVYKLPRAWEYGLAFYLGHEVPEWNAADHEAALLLTTCNGFGELKMGGYFPGSLDEPCGGIFMVPLQARRSSIR